MKTLILYYSRTGVTAAAAGQLAELLGADVEEVRDLKSRAGIVGYLSAGMDAMLKRPADIAPLARNPADYELLVFGTPVWAFTMAPAARTALQQCAQAGGKAAFFCTMGGSGDRRTFAHMAEAAGQAPVATLALLERNVRSDTHRQMLADFAAQLKAVQ